MSLSRKEKKKKSCVTTSCPSASGPSADSGVSWLCIVLDVSGADCFLKASLKAMLVRWCNGTLFSHSMSVKFIVGHLVKDQCLIWTFILLSWCYGLHRNAALTTTFSPGVTGSCCMGLESWRNQRWAQDVSQVVISLLPLKMNFFLQCLLQAKLSGSSDFCRPFVCQHPKPGGCVNHIQLQQVSWVCCSIMRPRYWGMILIDGEVSWGHGPTKF